MSLKYLIAIAAALALLFYFSSYSSSQFLDPTVERQEFQKWITKYNKKYVNQEEFELRLQIFSENYHRIQTFNSIPNQSHFLALNAFADQDPKEVGMKYAKGHHHGDFLNAVHPLILELDSSSLPASIDWRLKNAVTPIKDQGHCGACWAFSTIVGIEGLFAIKNNTLKTFSEQNLIECSTNGVNSGCAGGDPGAGYDYIRMVGVNYESDYPFVGNDKTRCHRNKSAPIYKIKSFVQVMKNDSDQLLAAVAQQPVSICIDGDNADFLYYGGGIYNSTTCGRTEAQLGHCLAIVGYGSENGVDYWIVKNSYGTDWGESGYARFYRQSGKGPGVCGLTLEALFPVAL